ncbi:hypothetical protein E2C01_015129 [Portunus trituberculatus]|uniref:Uncharacterized protein n=1 Tax=Portunus trituberculatus TaxID=210409 RepID=A0A5B7DKI3_PORTR|nr:hypothetical protein [Portunus trituberculatus]
MALLDEILGEGTSSILNLLPYMITWQVITMLRRGGGVSERRRPEGGRGPKLTLLMHGKIFVTKTEGRWDTWRAGQPDKGRQTEKEQCLAAAEKPCGELWET